MVGRREREFESKKEREGGKKQERDWGAIHSFKVPFLPFLPARSHLKFCPLPELVPAAGKFVVLMKHS